MIGETAECGAEAGGGPPIGFRKRSRWIALATLAGFALSSAVAAAAPLIRRRRDDTLSQVVAAPAIDTGVAPSSGAQAMAKPDAVASAEIQKSADHSLPAGMLDSPDALAARLTGSAASQDLILLIAGNGSGQALVAALETARRLSLESPTLLVDLGATQDWFADILDREDSGRIEVPGLADLLAGRASFSDVIQRDLTSSLDVIPSGGSVDRDALDLVFAALAASYRRIVFHASDWDAEPASAAADIADVVVIVAPPARLRRVLEESRPVLGAGGGEFLGLAARRSQPTFDEAA